MRKYYLALLEYYPNVYTVHRCNISLEEGGNRATARRRRPWYRRAT